MKRPHCSSEHADATSPHKKATVDSAPPTVKRLPGSIQTEEAVLAADALELAFMHLEEVATDHPDVVIRCCATHPQWKKGAAVCHTQGTAEIDVELYKGLRDTLTTCVVDTVEPSKYDTLLRVLDDVQVTLLEMMSCDSKTRN